MIIGAIFMLAGLQGNNGWVFLAGVILVIKGIMEDTWL